jgi:hypothetical protein
MMRRHELEPVSLTFGAAFAGLGLLFLLDQADQALRLRWVWPLLLLALGFGILLDLTRSHRRAGPDHDAEPATDPALEPAADPPPYPTDPEPFQSDPGPYPTDPDRDRTG